METFTYLPMPNNSPPPPPPDEVTEKEEEEAQKPQNKKVYLCSICRVPKKGHKCPKQLSYTLMDPTASGGEDVVCTYQKITPRRKKRVLIEN